MWRLHSLIAATGDFERLVRRLAEPKARLVRSVLETSELPELPAKKPLSRVPSRQLSRQRSEGNVQRAQSHDCSNTTEQRAPPGARLRSAPLAAERERERERESGPGGLTREVETPSPSNSPHDPMRLRGGLVGSHGRWKRPCVQTAHMAI
jgi:hypothetical protein